MQAPAQTSGVDEMENHSIWSCAVPVDSISAWVFSAHYHWRHDASTTRNSAREHVDRHAHVQYPFTCDSTSHESTLILPIHFAARPQKKWIFSLNCSLNACGTLKIAERSSPNAFSPNSSPTIIQMRWMCRRPHISRNRLNRLDARQMHIRGYELCVDTLFFPAMLWPLIDHRSCGIA